MSSDLPAWIVALSGPGTMIVGRVVSDLLDIVASKLPDGAAKKVVTTVSDLFGYFGAGSVRPK